MAALEQIQQHWTQRSHGRPGFFAKKNPTSPYRIGYSYADAALSSLPKSQPSRATQAAMPLLVLALLLPLQAQKSSPNLYAQGTQAMLDRSFPSPQTEYVLLDARTRQTIAQRWENADAPVPVGSLLKPFVALAYSRLPPVRAEAPGHAFPTVVCHGKRDGCWRTAGHGPMTLEKALAESCNAFFLALARALASSGDGALVSMSRAWGLPQPPQPRTAAMLIGITPQWQIPPVAIARAYATLADAGSGSPDRQTILRLLDGMRQAALPGGTAAKLGPHPGGALAKTGTAPCLSEVSGQRCVASGDGLVIVLAPAENPRWVLLVRRRGTTGAQTAEVAGEILTSLEDTHLRSR